MPIRIEYGVPALALRLAAQAGRGEQADRAFAQDMALLNFGLQQQRFTQQQAERDRAFALQEAMASRVAGTPTAGRDTRSPVVDHVLDRMKFQATQEEQGQQTQLDALEQMFRAGTIDTAAYERAKLGIMAGNEALVRGALLPKETTEPTRITATQAVSTLRQFFNRRRQAMEEQRRNLRAWLDAPGAVKAERRQEMQKQLDEIVSKLGEIDSVEAEALRQYRRGEHVEDIIDPLSGRQDKSADPHEGRTAIDAHGNRIVRRNGKWVPVK